MRTRKIARLLAAPLLGLFLVACVTASGSTQAQAEYKDPVYAPFNGPKKRIAVLEFENKVSNNWWDRTWNLEQKMTEMAITELMKTDRFIVVERGALDEVLAEQDLGASGRVRQETAARIGDVLGAQVLIKGTITEFIEKESGGVGGIAIGGIGIVGKSSTGHVAIDMRLIDATSGQILQSHRAEGKMTSKGIGGIAFFSGIAFGGATYKKTALGQATREAINSAVGFVVENMEIRPWEGRIVKADGNRIYVNAGYNMNIMNDGIFTVYSKGEELIDPATGLNLGSALTRTGTVRVVQVSDKFSIAEVIEGSGFKRGDVLKMQ
jgi:curli biogenesis system outer membrane secretion channel CsgG